MTFKRLKCCPINLNHEKIAFKPSEGFVQSDIDTRRSLG